MKRILNIVSLLSILALFVMLTGINTTAQDRGSFEKVPDISLCIHGIEKSQNITIGIEDIEKFHGSTGPGVALGYRACQIALSQLYPNDIPLWGDQFVISGSIRPCPVDAISYITGARYGKGSSGILNGNLAFDKSVGEFCFIFARISDGKAIKLTKTFQFPKNFYELRSKLKEKKTSFEKKKRCYERFQSLAIEILNAKGDDIFEVTTLPDFSWKNYKENYLK